LRYEKQKQRQFLNSWWFVYTYLLKFFDAWFINADFMQRIIEMNRKLSSAILSTLLLVFIQGCWAKEPSAEKPSGPKEADKAQQIKAILAEHKLEVWKGTCKECTEDRYQFCTRFYEDLKNADPDIKYIEPKFKTDDPAYPGLEHYQSACSDQKDLPNDASTFWGLWVMGDHGFRIYRKDFDKNTKDGEEELLFAVVHPEKKTSNWKGGYAFVDLSACIVRTGYPLHVSYRKTSDSQWKRLNNVDALIQYHDAYYAMEVHDGKGKPDDPSRYKVELWRLDSDLNFKQTCVIRWRPNLLKPKGE
jgi:hypothetical protein